MAEESADQTVKASLSVPIGFVIVSTLDGPDKLLNRAANALAELSWMPRFASNLGAQPPDLVAKLSRLFEFLMRNRAGQPLLQDL